MDRSVGGLQSIIFFQNFTTSCSIGYVECACIGGSGRGNERTEGTCTPNRVVQLEQKSPKLPDFLDKKQSVFFLHHQIKKCSARASASAHAMDGSVSFFFFSTLTSSSTIFL